MIQSIHSFDLKSYFKRWGFYLVLLLIILLGVIGGQNARFSISEDIFQNSSYQIAFITSFLSLTTIFFSTIFASQLLFKEADGRFELILFSSPIRKRDFVLGRFAALFSLSFMCLLLLIISFFVGHSFGASSSKITAFAISYYLYPTLFFGFINTFFACSFISLIGWLTQNKLMVYLSGLFLYILYMIFLIYSGSPLMAQSLPQSEQAQFISAIFDPFGFSAFFQQTSNWSVAQRNVQIISMSGIFLLNRVAVLLISIGMVFISVKKYAFIKTSKFKKAKFLIIDKTVNHSRVYKKTETKHDYKAQIRALLSFVKIDLIYIIKSIPFVITSLVLLFAVGMEMYAEIEKGIRLPQNYASTGLMVSTILQNFHGLSIIVVLYYTHEVFWRSKNVNFHFIENSTANIKTSFFSKWISIAFLILLFTFLMILEGISFQLIYQYPIIESSVYASIFVMVSFPKMLLAGFILIFQKAVNNKYIGLGLTSIFVLLMATPIGKKMISYPLLKFLHTMPFDYSDMNGFGIYATAFSQRLLFGFCLFAILMLLLNLSKKNRLKWPTISVISILTLLGIFFGTSFMKGYLPKDEKMAILSQANYEKRYRNFANLPQPTITDVKTAVDLFPDNNAYNIEGTYILENKSFQPISKVLINFENDFYINEAVLWIGSERIKIKNQYELVELEQAFLPGQKAEFKFKLSYKWQAINGHQSFNSIIENGSFIRISRYYPQFGYYSENEIQDDFIRNEYQLGAATAPKSFDSSKQPNNDFINLEMIVSTSPNQTAIGVGGMVNHYVKNNRNHFHYKTDSAIPFRFAISSAKYAIKKENYKGKSFEIYYHPKHFENVEHLLDNAKLTMDYCEVKFWCLSI